ncbi:uncharacterized protein VICG_00800 [Vittaforma corneae ATCC 50505]|uniref:Signal recognition particle SRP54 subunit M-domain domain-containing protein n=1 Tax=Vittaforma corneae (strain ATCC 50505) TaxID=993615 RepID=L2GPD1_VITCO|nr:uncharacterized protein VICG_00800 [Vittaforma corneae ATCC 50505]ELA42157.1 hypothetical protein VICG_00800 [Vittaforma corneae ATCC 50505]
MLEMIPGLGNMAIPNETKFKRIMHMFDSMIRKELESNGDVFLKEPGRIDRVARGSGTHRDLVKGYF